MWNTCKQKKKKIYWKYLFDFLEKIDFKLNLNLKLNYKVKIFQIY